MKSFLFALLLIATTKCNAGSWGVGSFENDGALDWINELIFLDSISALSETLERPLGQSYIDLDTCSYAIAAAEVVSSIGNGNLATLPEEIKDWLKQKERKLDEGIKNKALKAIDTCSDVSKSELAQLWYESSYEDWKSSINELRNRLQ
jgi:hypothetical protein